ncbi:MAG TPA: PQQ-dependent sugar dehydrogenase [Nitrososphaeraceae archaeon]|nr:PQQ-dependent sugar dehydrogenase [Nitrososphaeraceae archaeon]
MNYFLLDGNINLVRICFYAELILLIIFSIGYQHIQVNQNLSSSILALAAVDSKYPESAVPSSKGPTLKDPCLKTEVVFKGLSYPTGMAFLDKDDILVIEKDTGIVRRIVNGVMVKEPILDVTVAAQGHRGLLGIAISNDTSSFGGSPESINENTPSQHNVITKYVFLFYTAAASTDREDITEGKQPLGNMVYRYEFMNNKLINPKLLLNLPATPGSIGNGGKILFNPEDENLYTTIGGIGIDGHETKAQNIQYGKDPDGTSGILVITLDGNQAQKNSISILGDKDPINKYYAYGIWNSFGIDFDPVTGKLWDTENGVIFGDEINLVEPGFNSGWNKIDGIWLRAYPSDEAESHISSQEDSMLVNFEGKGKYSLPELTWFNDVGPTAIKFLNSDRLGKKYENDIFVGDIINGYIYQFDLDEQRSELLLPNGSLADKVIGSNDNMDDIIFGKGFGGITDMKIGPEDGYL